MKAEGLHSRAPLREAFAEWANAKFAIVALFGLVAGQAVVWYSGQFYALFFLTSVLKVDTFTGNLLIAWSLAAGTGGFIVFGWLSDKVGRKPIILGGCMLAALTYFPVFKHIADVANPALSNAYSTVTVTVLADPADCSFQFNPTSLARFTRSCDVATAALARASVSYTREAAPAGTPATIRIGDKILDAKSPVFARDLAATLTSVGYPAASNDSVVKLAHPWDIFRPQPLTLIALLAYLVILVTMVYGPIAAALVELFPTRIRYTSMSLPYHIGNGWFGGLLPATVFALNAQSGSIYFGLWYPVIIAAATAVIGLLFVPETRDRDIFDGDLTPRPGDRFVEFDPNAADY
jgi:MFS family permease